MLAPLRAAVLIWFWSFGVYASIYTPPTKTGKKPPQPAPPPPVFPVQVEVLRGESVEIPLPDYGPGVRFLVRDTPPKYGTVSLLKWKNGRTRFLYKHSGDKRHGSDSFVYASQSEGGVSPRAVVSISIADPKPILLAPDELDFGLVLVGESVTRKIKIQNRGGGILEGEATTEKPWEILRGRYRLEAGESCWIEVAFSPTSESNYGGQLRFSTERGRATLLNGAGRYAVVAGTREVILENVEGRRVGFLELSNRTDEARTVSVVGAEELEVPTRLEVPPRSSCKLEIGVRPEQRGPIAAALTIMDDRHSMEVAVRARGIDARLEAQPEKLSLTAKDTPASIELSNVGGCSTRVTASIPAPFEINAADVTFDLQPGEKRKVQVSLKTSGRYRSVLGFNGEKQRLEVPVDAKITDPEATNTAHQESDPASPSKPKKKAFNPGREVPGIMPLRLAEIGSSWAKLEWDAPKSAGSQAGVELRLVRMEGALLKTEWLPLGDVQYSSDGQTSTAKIRGLHPRAVYTMRVSYSDSKGRRTATSAVLQICTKQSLWEKLTFFHIVCATAVFLVALVVYGRRGEQD